ncbi:hypothetical protein FRC17_003423, partial [Serendipita sp. 399]
MDEKLTPSPKEESGIASRGQTPSGSSGLQTASHLANAPSLVGDDEDDDDALRRVFLSRARAPAGPKSPLPSGPSEDDAAAEIVILPPSDRARSNVFKFQVNPRQRTNSTIQLIDWLFSPPDTTVSVPPFVGGTESIGYRNFAIKSKIPVDSQPDADWQDLRSHLESDDSRTELANDLVEVYFQICHNRLPLLDSTDFRTRLRAFLYPTSSLDPAISPLPPALLATVIAWGAKFSEHPLLVHDRGMNDGKSRLSRLITKRAREVAEGEKVHRVPTADNVIVALLLEPLHSHNPSDLDGLNGFWLNCAIRHLFELGVNRRSRLLELDEHSRAMMTYAWFMALLSDAFAAVYWRKKPVIDEDDFDVGFGEDASFVAYDASLSTQEATQNWLAVSSLANVARKLAKDLSKPNVTTFGMPLQVLKRCMENLQAWKEQYLQLVGVPDNYQANWDFAAAVAACTCDAQYHVMWVILHSALDEFSIREAKEGTMTYTALHEIERQVFDEALQGALRISGLTSVLTSNGYLRLDPNILHFSTYAAGMFLARYGKPEVKTCIQGLEQYSFAYEEAHEQAQWMQQVYANSLHQLQPPLRPHSVLSTSSS